MKVILKEEILKLGKPGDIADVSEGYARNFLLPQKKAIPATKENIKNIELHRKWILKRQEKNLIYLREMAQKIGGLHCTLEQKAGKNNKLFGSITSQDLYKFLLQKGFTIEKACIRLTTPLKEIGDFEVPVRLHPEINTVLKVTIHGKQ